MADVDYTVTREAAAAIVAAIPDDDKKKIASNAVKWLLRDDGYGKTPLARAAESEIEDAIRPIILGFVENDQRVLDYLSVLYQEAVARLLDPGRRNQFVDQMAANIASCLLSGR
jgi:hypothetical protein